MTTKTGLLAAAALACVVIEGGARAADKPSPYNGGEPARLATMPNGAIVNARLADDPFLRSDPRLIKVRDRVWTVTGYALSNCSFVETDNGIVVFDTGSNVGQGEYFLQQIRKVSNKPVVAIIYSHTHYTGGASALAAGGRNVPIYAHANLTRNQNSRSLDRAPSFLRRANLQFGGYLPKEGEDAGVTTPEPEFADPAKTKVGFLPVTHSVEDGEDVVIDGMRFVFRWAEADTTDSLTVWLPGLRTVLTNSVTNMFYPLYTLRGEEFRDPRTIIEGYDEIRALEPDYYVPVHGDPVIGKEAIERRLVLHRDAYSFAYNQAVRGINLGWTPDEIVERTRLPQRFLDEPTLNQVYSEFDYALRGIYRGLIGWFAEDAAELNPPSPGRVGKAVLDGFGGMAPLLAASRQALARKEYDLAASLAGFAVDAEPDNRSARQVKAGALRHLARVSRGFQSYNFYLTEARALEGKVNRFGLPPVAHIRPIPPEALAKVSPLELVKVLESRVDPIATSGIVDAATVRFAEAGALLRIDVRDGIAEVVETQSPAPLAIRVTRLAWANFLQGKIAASELFQSKAAAMESGRSTDAVRFLGWFRDPAGGA